MMEAKVLGGMAAKEAKRGRDDLGLVETIYEEEDEDKYEDDDSATSLSALSPELPSPSPTPIHSCIKSWCRATGHETDVVICVQNSRFHLHKERLTNRSGYLKRQLKKVAELTLSPPLKITAETFTMLVEFFYDADLIITPFNVVAVRTAAELLEMTGGEGLVQKTENYFRRAVTVRPEYTLIVLRSALSLLPESETTACLASRCIEALCVMDEDGVTGWMGDVKELAPKDFLVILESMNQRLSSSHDLLYKLVDLYLKEYNGKMTDEQKMGICHNVNCAILSPRLVMHAVQNPRMPLRFVVQAMFVEQLNTRRSIVSAADHHIRIRHNQEDRSNSSMTLGAIPEGDAALRQAAHLKEAMHATSSRIQSLEKELSDMRKFLKEPSDDATDSCRSASFRLISSLNKIGKGDKGSVSSGSFRLNSESKIDKGEKGHVSSSSFRILSNKDKATVARSSSSEWSQDESPGVAKYNLPRRFIKGLISTFRISKKKPTETTGKLDGGKAGNAKSVDDDGNVDAVVV